MKKCLGVVPFVLILYFITANGILRDPRKASAERGEAYLEQLADFMVSKIGPTGAE